MSDFKPFSVQVEVFEDGQKYSTPSVLNVWSACKTIFGVRFCVSIKAHINGVHMCVSVAGFEQCFGIGGNGCFDFEMGVARIGVCIGDFTYSGGQICFNFKIRGCVGVKIPFDGSVQKCKTLWQEYVCVPLFAFDEAQIIESSEEKQLEFLQTFSRLHDYD